VHLRVTQTQKSVHFWRRLFRSAADKRFWRFTFGTARRLPASRHHPMAIEPKGKIYPPKKGRKFSHFPVDEARMRARWKLGQLLTKEERGRAPGKGKMISTAAKSFLIRLKNWGARKRHCHGGPAHRHTAACRPGR
jgi:hypothetical protein